mgnify:CR=1 FL=1
MSILENIKLLDCTLRDGGHALEDMAYHKNETKLFNSRDKENLIVNLNKAQIEIIEIGSIADGIKENKGFSVYTDIEETYKDYADRLHDDQEFAIIYRDPHLYKNFIPNWREGLPKIARVIIRYFDLTKSFDFCRTLANKGYKVFIQPMATIQYSEEELVMLTNLANEINAQALYIVDTYGAMMSGDIKKIFNIFDKFLDKKINIGLHAHDNLQLAFQNSIDFLQLKSSRGKIVDCTAYGMGLGAGNCKTELIASYINKNFNKKYNLEKILSACEVVETLNGTDQNWGVGLVNTLPALENVATKYVQNLRYDHKLTYDKIYKVLKLIPNKIKQQYSKENMKVVSNLLKN